jgi:hypothetical protein
MSNWKSLEQKAKQGKVILYSVKMVNNKKFYFATVAIDEFGNQFRITTKTYWKGVSYLLFLGAIDKRKVI